MEGDNKKRRKRGKNTDREKKKPERKESYDILVSRSRIMSY
jgi:hypothetical protein